MMASPNIVYAIHNFEAENEDEVTFRYGEPIVILEKDDQFLDGWWQGRNAQGETGLFPVSYTSTEKPLHTMNNGRLSSHKDDVYQHNRMSSGTSSGSSDGYRISTTCSSILDSEDSSHDSDLSNTSEVFGVSNSSPIYWNMEDVVTWLESVGLELVVDNFIDQEITGDVLLNLDHDSLKELGITAYGRRYKVMNAITNLRSSLVNNQVVPIENNRHSTNSFIQSSRCGSVTESLLNKNSSISSLKSSVSSSAPRTVIPTDALTPNNNSNKNKDSLYRSSFTPRANTKTNDSHNSQYGDNILCLSSVTQSSTINSSKRCTFDASVVSQRSTILSDGNTNILNLPPSPPTSAFEQDITPPVKTSPNCSYPEYEGWIFKQSNQYKTWNKRWFVLYGTNLFYFKNPKDTRMKGIIHLHGYHAILEPSNTSNKKYNFKLHHDRERTFYFYTNNLSDMKHWVQALMKTTIKRDLCVPVVSSNTVDTVSLDIAQKMKLRPPSTLMYSKNEYNTNNQRYGEAIMKDVVNNTLEEELDETLLWMEHPHQQEEPFQKLIIRSYPSFNEEEDLQEENQQLLNENESFIDPLQEQHYSKMNESCSDPALLRWVNTFLTPTSEIHDLSQSFRSGDILIQLLETLCGKTINRCQNQVSASMTMLDNIVEAFKFMNREGVVNDGYTIKDIFSGKEEKVVEMVYSIKNWSEQNNWVTKS